MSKVFVIDGEPYMACQPSEALHKSTLVKRVINSEDTFAVNMTTGILTIVSKTRLIEAGYFRDELGNFLSEKRIKEAKPLVIQASNGRVTENKLHLSNDFNQGITTLYEEFVNKPREIARLYVFSNFRVNPVNFLASDSWISYIEKVRKLYTASHVASQKTYS